MRAVNLLPREAKRSDGLLADHLVALVAAAVALVVVAALGGMVLLENAKVTSARQGLDAAKAQFAATPLPPTAAPTLPTPTAVTAAQQPLFASVATALSQRIAWDRVLREFSLVLPNDVWVTSLSLKTPTATPDTTGLQLQGTTYSYAGVARLLSRLSLVPDLTAVTLGPTSRTGTLVSFSISAGIKGAAAVPPASVAGGASS